MKLPVCDTCDDKKLYYYGQRAFCADCEDDLPRELQKKLNKAIKCIEFYAYECCVDNTGELELCEEMTSMKKMGETARQTLKELKGE